jgi:hypothetical protein
MAIYYVAAGARYAMAEAENEFEAREQCSELLAQIYPEIRQRHTFGLPIPIDTVREATPSDMQLWRWFKDVDARHYLNHWH